MGPGLGTRVYVRGYVFKGYSSEPLAQGAGFRPAARGQRELCSEKLEGSLSGLGAAVPGACHAEDARQERVQQERRTWGSVDVQTADEKCGGRFFDGLGVRVLRS